MNEGLFVPQEIKQAIIDELGYGLEKESGDENAICRAALNSCSLASYELLHCARRHKFATLDLYPRHIQGDDEIRRERVQSLTNLIESNPGISQSVRNVTLEAHYWKTSKWIINDESVPRLFRALPLLRSFNFGFHYGFLPGMGWAELGHDLQASIIGIIKSEYLTNLRLWNLNKVPLDLFTAGSSLKELELRTIGINGSNEEPAEEMIESHLYPQARIASLKISTFMGQTLQKLVKTAKINRRYMDFSELQSFSADIYSAEDINAIVEMLLNVSSTLRNLTIFSVYSNPPPEMLGHINLNNVPQLRTITLQTRLYPDDTTFALCHILRHANLPKLDTVTCIMDFGGLPEEGFPLGFDWHELDEILGAQQLTALRTVKFIVKLSYLSGEPIFHGSDEWNKRKAAAIRGALPKLTSSNSIELELSIFTYKGI